MQNKAAKNDGALPKTAICEAAAKAHFVPADSTDRRNILRKFLCWDKAATAIPNAPDLESRQSYGAAIHVRPGSPLPIEVNR